MKPELNDQLPVWVTVKENSFCDCCKQTHMKRVFHISSTLMDDFDLGYVCAGYWFKLNLSGNITKARAKLAAKLNSMPTEEIMRILDQIIAEGEKNMVGLDGPMFNLEV